MYNYCRFLVCCREGNPLYVLSLDVATDPVILTDMHINISTNQFIINIEL